MNQILFVLLIAFAAALALAAEHTNRPTRFHTGAIILTLVALLVVARVIP
jgi:hypothetical protein